MLDIVVIIILFGAIQGFGLCLFLSIKKKVNKRAFGFYFMFLFSLSFFNLLYAFLCMDINVIAGIPLSSFPFPYKYLIGVGFYFYIKSQISKEEEIIDKREYLLFLPAVFYGLLRAYWYVNQHTGIDKDIFLNVYKTGFFSYNEFVYLIFNLLLVFFAIRFLKSNRLQIKGFNRARKNWDWLLKFSYAFVAFTVLNLFHQIIMNLTNLEDNGQLYLLILILNTIYIYWVGLESLTKSKLLFNKFYLKQKQLEKKQALNLFAQKLEYYVKTEEVFTNKNLKIADLAHLIDTTEKELSLYVHEMFEMSFSDYINQYRVEKVKKLLRTEDQKKYTLLAISEKAGFSSKSTFNAVFKKMTGITPTQYNETPKN